MTSKLTVSAKWLEKAAAQIERDAQDRLTSWILLGQSHRYCDDMLKARNMRKAAQIKNIGERREFLRSIGVEA